MNHTTFRSCWVAAWVFCCALVVSPAWGTILLFDNDPDFTNFGILPVNYGDNVNALTMGTFNYGLGKGFTPNIALDYRTLDIAGGNSATLNNYLTTWTTGYNELIGVAYPTEPTSTGEIAFVPEPGYAVRLNSFQVGNWSFFAKNQHARLYDEDYNLLQTYPLALPGSGSGSSVLVTPNYTHGGKLILQFGLDWNVGIDNVNFDQIVIPEPSVVAGLVVLVIFASYCRLRRMT
ncbi:MAG: PEP-CTERM sorting domain-containing protein [Pirellulales bacterium]|nr:PEP-CTERM sorting domain-containing protein [Pirellulales bacterium]